MNKKQRHNLYAKIKECLEPFDAEVNISTEESRTLTLEVNLFGRDCLSGAKFSIGAYISLGNKDFHYVCWNLRKPLGHNPDFVFSDEVLRYCHSVNPYHRGKASYYTQDDACLVGHIQAMAYQVQEGLIFSPLSGLDEPHSHWGMIMSGIPTPGQQWPDSKEVHWLEYLTA